MSSKGVQPQKGVQRGVKAGRSSVMLLASPEMIEAMKLPPPKGQLDVLPQSFQGRPSPPIEAAQVKIRKAAQENPLLMPGMGPKLSSSKIAADSGISLAEAPIAKVKKLRMVKEEKIEEKMAPVLQKTTSKNRRTLRQKTHISQIPLSIHHKHGEVFVGL